MRRIVGFLSVLIVVAAAMVSFAEKKPELKLKGPRMVFMKPRGMYQYTPAMVRVSATLEGEADDPEKYYCLVEEWEWGDETESLHEPDCDPYEEGAELKKNWSASHTFRYPGTYTVWLRLYHGDDVVIAGRTRIQVRGQ